MGVWGQEGLEEEGSYLSLSLSLSVRTEVRRLGGGGEEAGEVASGPN